MLTGHHEPTEPSKSLTSIPTDPDRPLVAGTLRPNEIAEFGRRNDLSGFAGRRGDGRTLALALEIRALYYMTVIDHNMAVPANLRQTRTAWAAREGKTTRQINAESGRPPRHQTNRANTKTLPNPTGNSNDPTDPTDVSSSPDTMVRQSAKPHDTIYTGDWLTNAQTQLGPYLRYQSAVLQPRRLSDWRLGRRRTIV